MKRVTYAFCDPRSSMWVMIGAFGMIAAYLFAALVRRMSELATDWRLDGPWPRDVSHALALVAALLMIAATLVALWRKVRE